MTKKQEQAAEAATTPEITGETEAKIEHKTPCVYCGPSVRGVPAATPRRRWTSL